METTVLDVEELRGAIRERLADGDLQAVRRGGEEGGGFERALWSELGELGWLGLSLPEEYGGLGMGFAEEAVLHEELGRHLTRLPVLPTLLAAHAIASAGTAAQKAELLPPIAEARCAASIALPFGRHPRSLPRVGADGSIGGSVAHVLYADSVDMLLLPVVEANGAIALCRVRRDAPGVSVRRDPAIDLTRDLGTVTLDRVKPASDAWLRPSPRQWSDLADLAAAALACDAMGAAQHILERTVEYMCTRVQFDRPIGSFQALKHRAASWKILQEAAGALARHAAGLIAGDSPERAAAASEAKFYACDAFAAIAGDAVQLHGGIGFTWEHECHLFLKRAKLSQVLFGTSTEHKERAAERLFQTGLPA
jgi:alkylation response protein AidB-like acyl-CoA dehydrogenase